MALAYVFVPLDFKPLNESESMRVWVVTLRRMRGSAYPRLSAV